MGSNKESENQELTAEQQLEQLSGPYELTNGQLQWLMERMSSDDQKMLKDKMKACARDTFFTRACKHYFRRLSMNNFDFSTNISSNHGVCLFCTQEITGSCVCWAKKPMGFDRHCWC